ncbi:hypothetical protein [Yoonia sediminilitoris]|uniref:Uncharacterized protein n=1 Tax=Yoonia sediminilitoris TaxID=1286148 RepID=A0A2T6K7P4_9RHOB|nr:hypothetical protein [Yoonia sediminilitoris]PUB10735.1 hypothetical protein C8N45_11781 [Yoonia sediminilitoris]RCW90487.1 hypothetical protein DFP92_11781 [Yoonia sediminilitoris]
MALDPKRTRQLRAMLRRLSAANAISSIPGGTGKALEAWVFMTLADAARQKTGWQVTLHQGDGSRLPPNHPFVFSGGPSGLSQAVGDPCFARLHRSGGSEPRTLELHHGLQHKGRSGARHEWDIALLPTEIPQGIRATNAQYPRGLPFLGIECKDKLRSGNSDEMRQTLARMFDLAHVTQLRGSVTHRMMDEHGTAGTGRRWPTYLENYSHGAFGVVHVGGFQLGPRDMSDHYKIQRFGHVTTSNTATRNALEVSMSRVLDRIDQLY